MTKYIGGLFQAKIGDRIEIGIQGQRFKHRTEIVAIGANRRLRDSWGNIFNRDGQLYRRASHPINVIDKKRKVSAQLVVQEQHDSEYRRIRSFDFSRMTTKDIEALIDNMPVKQANTLQTSRFTK